MNLFIQFLKEFAFNCTNEKKKKIHFIEGPEYWHKWPFHILHMGKGHVKASECHSAPSKTDVTVNISLN